jgi:hypothetical protein
MMKKLIVCILLFAAISGIAFSQNSNDWNWGGTVRFRPMATVMGLLVGASEVVVDWVPYVAPNVGIPIEIDIGTVGEVSIFCIMSGVEGIPVGNKEKNGLYLTAIAGPIFAAQYISFGAKADIGYQLVTDGGFVFTPAIGVKYYGFSGVSLDLMLDIGFAYRKK